MHNLITGAKFARGFPRFLFATPLASHVNDWPKFLLVIFTGRQHDRLLQESVDAVEHVLAAVGDVRNLMESLHVTIHTERITAPYCTTA